jgi:hypothetical protein
VCHLASCGKTRFYIFQADCTAEDEEHGAGLFSDVTNTATAEHNSGTSQLTSRSAILTSINRHR